MISLTGAAEDLSFTSWVVAGHGWSRIPPGSSYERHTLKPLAPSAAEP
jgi:hypothetical protein